VVYQSLECEGAVPEWTDQRAAFQGSPVALLGSCTEFLVWTDAYGADRSRIDSNSFCYNFDNDKPAHAV
jgi:hypothetical protein